MLWMIPIPFITVFCCLDAYKGFLVVAVLSGVVNGQIMIVILWLSDCFCLDFLGHGPGCVCVCECVCVCVLEMLLLGYCCALQVIKHAC
jgi:hypothetical protein